MIEPTLTEIIPTLLNGVFSRRVWRNRTPDDLPRADDGSFLPFCVWTLMGGSDEEYLDQTMPDKLQARIQLWVNSPSAKEAETLCYRARDALLASIYTVGVYGSPVGTYDAARKLEGQRQQFSIGFRQPQ